MTYNDILRAVNAEPGSDEARKAVRFIVAARLEAVAAHLRSAADWPDIAYVQLPSLDGPVVPEGEVLASYEITLSYPWPG